MYPVYGYLYLYEGRIALHFIYSDSKWHYVSDSGNLTVIYSNWKLKHSSCCAILLLLFNPVCSIILAYFAVS